MKLLIVKTSALGDVVHALPVLAYLKSTRPDVRIDWLVEEAFAPLIADHPLLNRVIVLRTKNWRRSAFWPAAAGVWRVIRGLRRQGYDRVLDLQGNSKSGLFTRLAGSCQRYGFDRSGVREWPNLLATTHRVHLGDGVRHVSRRSLAVARAAVPGGSEERWAGPLSVSPAAVARVAAQLQGLGLAPPRERPLVVLHYGTTWPTKRWRLASWQALAVRLIRELNATLLLTWGTEGEKKAATAIAAAGRQALIWPRGSLPDLAALLASVDLLVGCDTGPVHIAAALGTPTVSVYRATDARRNAPRGPQHRCLQVPLECAACLRKRCERDRQCAESVSVERVFGAVKANFDR
ncbi:MAG: lipopolysaccharide heptosyltransferase I [Desulfobacteraceae bacterium]|nr:lipopolysaccharide heptosyltransferase I [Desulfobacteraceae bacterium]